MAQATESARGRARLGSGYWRVWWANTISCVGDGAFVSALPLLAATITRDPRLIAVVSVAFYLPWLLLSLPAGALVDRHERVGLMWRAQAVQGAVVAVIAVLAALHESGMAVLTVAAFCLGTAEVVFSNAAQAVLPHLVPADQLPRANGNLQVSLTVGETFLGPPVGSVLFAAARILPFGLDSVSFIASAALLSGLPRTTPGGPAGGLGTRIADGLRWLLRHRLLRVVAMLLGIGGFCSQMGQAVLVLFATQALHISARGYGLLWTASALGSIAGGLASPVLTSRLGQIPSLIISMAGTALAFAGIGLAPDAVAAGLLMAGNGFFVAMWNVVTVSLRQRIVPSYLLGRVNSVYRMIGWGLMPAGALAGGFVAQAGGLRAPYVVGGITCAVTLVAALPGLIRAQRMAAG